MSNPSSNNTTNNNPNKNSNLTKKLSSFELCFVERNQSNNSNVSLTDNLIELENKSLFNNTSKQPKNIRMSTIEYSNDNNSNINTNNNNNAANNKNTTAFNSPELLNFTRRNYMNSNNYRSSMELYRLKLSKSKLKAVTRTSALLSGFAMVAMVELNLDYSDYFEAMKQAEIIKATALASTTTQAMQTMFTNASLTNETTTRQVLTTTALSHTVELSKFLIPESILILYSLVTCLLVGVHMLALMISTCILPQLEASSYEQIEFEQQLYKHEYHFLNQTHLLNLNQSQSDNKLRSKSGELEDSFNNTKMNGYNSFGDSEIIFPYKKFHRFIELAWISSTVLGIFLFLVEIGLICYIKFYPISFIAALTGAIVMTPILILFVIFTIFFYKRLADFKMNITKHFFNQVDRNLLPLHENVI